VKDWEIIADNLSKAGWSWGCVSAIDREGRTVWIVDAHGYGKRFIVRADELLTAFVELERGIHEFAVSLILQKSPLKIANLYAKWFFEISLTHSHDSSRGNLFVSER
jgi:hypothetical protein